MKMKAISIALGAGLAAVAATASAQIYYRPYVADPFVARGDVECWNPRAGVFERLRPGDYQPDLDRSRCRAMGAYYGDRYYGNRYSGDRYYGARTWYEEDRECWNPRAGVYERVREGDYQPDLDRRYCRRIARETYAWR